MLEVFSRLDVIQSFSQSVVPESDVFTSPSGKVAVDYFPGNGAGGMGNNSTVNIVSVNDTLASNLEVVGSIINRTDMPSFVIVGQLFVTDISAGYSSGQTLNNNDWSIVARV